MKNKSSTLHDKSALQRVHEFILDGHPCVMARSVVANDQIMVSSYKSMNQLCPHHLLADMKAYLEDVEVNSMNFQTFIAVFEETDCSTELEFENNLWKILHNLRGIDTHSWDDSTSSNPVSPKFSYSLLGTSFYIVGMHPNSSRWARSSPVPMVVFNLHSQFELLRKEGNYDRVRDLIRQRDEDYQGSVNPMVKDFGEDSEAKQYSGRAVEPDWKCPYKFENNSQ